MQQCLALNATYEPMVLMPLKRAVRLVLQGKAEILEGGADLRSGSHSMPTPMVIKLNRLVRVPKRLRRQVSNTFLFARDQYTCQYCGRHEAQLGKREGLNRDHVQPKSRGGANSWDNCATACSTCNTKKANRTPAEAGMQLRSVPTEPHMVALKWSVRRLTELQEKYISMFYGSNWRDAVTKR